MHVSNDQLERFSTRLQTALNDLVFELSYESKAQLEEDLGQALGYQGRATIERWQKRKAIPKHKQHYTALVSQIIAWSNKSAHWRTWLDEMLIIARYSTAERNQLAAQLFGSVAPPDTMVDATPPIAPTVVRESQPVAPDATAPFIANRPITDQPARFFGRTSALTQIFQRINTYPFRHTMIIGPKGSGKTSLLHYIRQITRTPASFLRADQHTAWLRHPEHYRWIYVDFDDSRWQQPERLLTHLLVGMEMDVPHPCTLPDFMDVVEHTQIQHPTIILMDEIDRALTYPDLDPAFWRSLRSLGTTQSNERLGMLITGRHPPVLPPGDLLPESLFFNIFNNLYLSALTPDEAAALITSAPIAFTPADQEWIMTQSRCWPVTLQILCEIGYAAYAYPDPTVDWKADGLRAITPYTYLWHTAGTQEGG